MFSAFGAGERRGEEGVGGQTGRRGKNWQGDIGLATPLRPQNMTTASHAEACPKRAESFRFGLLCLDSNKQQSYAPKTKGLSSASGPASRSNAAHRTRRTLEAEPTRNRHAITRENT